MFSRVDVALAALFVVVCGCFVLAMHLVSCFLIVEKGLGPGALSGFVPISFGKQVLGSKLTNHVRIEGLGGLGGRVVSGFSNGSSSSGCLQVFTGLEVRGFIFLFVLLRCFGGLYRV